MFLCWRTDPARSGEDAPSPPGQHWPHVPQCCCLGQALLALWGRPNPRAKCPTACTRNKPPRCCARRLPATVRPHIDPRDGLSAEVRTQTSRENAGACGTACYQCSRAAVCGPFGAFELKTWDLRASMGRDWCPLVLQGGLAPRINS